MNIKLFTDEVQLWNFTEKRFDEVGTPYSWDDHCNENYHLEDQQQLMKDVINCGDNHYWATVIDAGGQDVILTPGFYRINRLGYCIYKADEPIPSDHEYDI